MRLPDFVIVGAQKCGTTALRNALNKHPDVHMGSGVRINGEPHFFDRHFKRGLNFYTRQFKAGRVNGDKTPSYLANPLALVRMHRAVPDAKVVVLLRDPVLRLASAYSHTKRRHRKRQIRGAAPSFMQFAQNPDALWRGCYAAQLQLLYTLYPHDQVQVILSEDMWNRTACVVHDLQEWLGLNARNVTSPPKRPRREFPNGPLKCELAAKYRASNRALMRLLSNPRDVEKVSRWIGVGNE